MSLLEYLEHARQSWQAGRLTSAEFREVLHTALDQLPPDGHDARRVWRALLATHSLEYRPALRA